MEVLYLARVCSGRSRPWLLGSAGPHPSDNNRYAQGCGRDKSRSKANAGHPK